MDWKERKEKHIEALEAELLRRQWAFYTKRVKLGLRVDQALRVDGPVNYHEVNAENAKKRAAKGHGRIIGEIKREDKYKRLKRRLRKPDITN